MKVSKNIISAGVIISAVATSSFSMDELYSDGPQCYSNQRWLNEVNITGDRSIPEYMSPCSGGKPPKQKFNLKFGGILKCESEKIEPIKIDFSEDEYERLKLAHLKLELPKFEPFKYNFSKFEHLKIESSKLEIEPSKLDLPKFEILTYPDTELVKFVPLADSDSDLLNFEPLTDFDKIDQAENSDTKK